MGSMRSTHSSLYIKIARTLLLIVLCLTLPSCSFFKERQVKSQATSSITDSMEQSLTTEVKAALGEKGVRNKDFVDYVMNHTEIEVVSVQEVSPSQYQVQTKVHTMSPESKKVIFGILANSDYKRASAFNFSDGLELIHHERPDLPINVDQKIGVDVHEDNSGNWVGTASN
jgi:hypothetical protein